MKKYHFDDTDEVKVKLLLDKIPDFTKRHEQYLIVEENYKEIYKKLRRDKKEYYKNFTKRDKEFESNYYEIEKRINEPWKELVELVREWNEEMNILSKKYGYIKLSDFHAPQIYDGQSRLTVEFNSITSYVAKNIGISLLYNIVIGYGKVKLTNFYPKSWLKLVVNDLYKDSKNDFRVLKLEKYKV